MRPTANRPTSSEVSWNLTGDLLTQRTSATPAHPSGLRAFLFLKSRDVGPKLPTSGHTGPTELGPTSRSDGGSGENVGGGKVCGQ